MIARCPSCGSATKEEERVCPSCGWDFVARKRVAKPGSPPSEKADPPAPALPSGPSSPEGGGFALPPAKNLNEAASGAPLGLKPLPKIAPRETPLGADENPFTLPSARGPALPSAPPPAPPSKPDPAPRVPEKPAPDAPSKDGLGARLMRSLRGEAAPAATNSAIPDASSEPAEKKGFSLPAARIIEPDPAVAPPEPTAEAEAAPRVGELPPLLPAAAEPDPTPDIEIIEEPAPKPKAKPRPAAEPRPEPPANKAPTAAPAPAPAPAPLPELETLSDPLAGADLLPSGPAATGPSPAAPPQGGASTPAPAAAPPAGGARNSPVYIAAVAGAALGTVSVLAVYLLLRNDTSTARPAADPPFARGTGSPMGAPTPPAAAAAAPAAPVTPAPAPASPAPVVGNPDVPLPKTLGAPSTQGGPITVPVPSPAPKDTADAGRPAATFTVAPRVVLAGQEPSPKAKAKPQPQSDDEDTPDETPSAPAPKAARRGPAEPSTARKPKGPAWTFEGVVFDLLTARGVFAAKLIFLDPDGNQAGMAETGPGGRYKVQLPVLAGGGYTMKTSHQDYTERYIDEGDATSSLREATPEERKILMSAASRNLPWVGTLKKSVHRDLALVPRSQE